MEQKNEWGTNAREQELLRDFNKNGIFNAMELNV